MDAQHDRSNDYELQPDPLANKKPRTLHEAVHEYWHRVSDERDSPRSTSSGGELV